MEQGNVCQVYEKIAAWFDKNRCRDLFEKSWLDKFLSYLPVNPQVLDLGCGMGEPIIPYFLENGCKVTGVDGCEHLLSLAREKFWDVEFLLTDMRTLDLKKNFDGIIAWHSFFHLTKAEQTTTLPIIASHLKKGGSFLFTTGPSSGEVWSDNGGQKLYHTSFGYDEYQILLHENGFEISDYMQSDPDCGDATVWLVKKTKDTSHDISL